MHPKYTPKSHLQNVATVTNKTTAEEAFAAPADSNDRNYVTDIVIANSSATDTEVDIKDGTTLICKLTAPANSGSNATSFITPLRGSKNAAINVHTIDAVTSVFVTMTGFVQR
jgi:hypothetical protein